MPTRPKSHTLSRVPRVKLVCCLRSDVIDPVGTYTPAYGSTSITTCATAPSADREQRTSGATSARIDERLTNGGPFPRSTHVKVKPSGDLYCGLTDRASVRAITTRQLQALVRQRRCTGVRDGPRARAGASRRRRRNADHATARLRSPAWRRSVRWIGVMHAELRCRSFREAARDHGV